MLTDSVRFTEVAFAEIESVNNTDSESATLFAWVSDIESVPMILIQLDSQRLLLLRSNLSSYTDSESATLFAWVSDIESVNDIDSVRFTEVAFAEIESVNNTDSESATLFAWVSDISNQ